LEGLQNFGGGLNNLTPPRYATGQFLNGKIVFLYVICFNATLHSLLLDLIFIHYVLRYIEKDILSREYITESTILATYDLGYCPSSRRVTNIRLKKISNLSLSLEPTLKTQKDLVSEKARNLDGGKCRKCLLTACKSLYELCDI